MASAMVANYYGAHMLPLRQHAGRQAIRERMPLDDLGQSPSLNPLKFLGATLSKLDGTNGAHVLGEPFHHGHVRCGCKRQLLGQ